MNSHKNIFYSVREKLVSLEKFIAGFSLLLLLILSLSQVVLRNLFELGYAEIDIISRHLVLFITFMGAALACESSQHIKIDVVNSLLKQQTREKLQQPLLLISTLICCAFFYYALQFWLDEKLYAPVNEQLALYLALIIPLGFFTLSLHFFLLFITGQFFKADK